MTLPALGKSGYVAEFKFRAIVKSHPAGKRSEQLPAFKGVKEHLMVFIPLLLRRKTHFQPVVVTGETPGHKPARWYVEGYLIQLVEFAVQKKSVFRSLRGIRGIVPHTETRLAASGMAAAGCPETQILAWAHSPVPVKNTPSISPCKYEFRGS